MNPTAYPIVTAFPGKWPLRCTFTGRSITPGQQVVLSPLGYISLATLSNHPGQPDDTTQPLTYLRDVLQTYCQRQGSLRPDEAELFPLAEELLTTLFQAIPTGQSRYVHQLLQVTDLTPWLNALACR